MYIYIKHQAKDNIKLLYRFVNGNRMFVFTFDGRGDCVARAARKSVNDEVKTRYVETDI